MNLEPIRALLELVKERNRLCEKGADFAAIETGERIPRLVYAASPALSQLLEAVTWIKCSERMPERGQWCLVIWKGYLQHEAYQFNGDWVPSHDDDDHVAPNDFSHWMPLPSPPEDK